jgi:hypothetical protein
VNNGLELRAGKAKVFPIAEYATGLVTDGSQNPEQGVPSFCNSAYNTYGQYFLAYSWKPRASNLSFSGTLKLDRLS